MLKKLLIVSVAALLLVAATAPAHAVARAYYGAVVQITDSAKFGNQVWSRPYNPLVTDPTKAPSAGLAANCPVAGNTNVTTQDLPTRSCQLKWNSLGGGVGVGGYRAANDDITNETQTEGPRIVLFDATTGQGASRAGYYFVAAGSVTAADPKSNFQALGCVGTVAATCVGMGENANATGFGLQNTPVPLDTVGGFRPIPVPLINTSNRDTGDISLVWRAAASVGTAIDISYDLWGVAKDTCTPPVADTEYNVNLGTYSATAAVVNTTAFGGTVPSAPKCYYFAIRLSYPTALASGLRSRFLSGNSAGAAFGGIAASVTGITARAAGGQGVAVAWQTSLEDGVKGFYVTRSIGSATGTYERVSGLITAKGQPSSYTYVDSTLPVGQVRAKGVYYKIDTVDVDDQIQSFGPAKAELTTGRPPKEGQQLRQKPVTSR